MSDFYFSSACSQYSPFSIGFSTPPFGTTTPSPEFSSGSSTTSSFFGSTPGASPVLFGATSSFASTTQSPFASGPLSSVAPNPMFSSVSPSTSSLFGTTRTTFSSTTPPPISSSVFSTTSSPSLFGVPSSRTTTTTPPLFSTTSSSTPSFSSSFQSTTSSTSSVLAATTPSLFSTTTTTTSTSTTTSLFDSTTSSTIASTTTTTPSFPNLFSSNSTSTLPAFSVGPTSSGATTAGKGTGAVAVSAATTGSSFTCFSSSSAAVSSGTTSSFTQFSLSSISSAPTSKLQTQSSTSSTTITAPLFSVPPSTTAAATTSTSATEIEVESPSACDAEIVVDNIHGVIYLGYHTAANQNVIEPGTIIHNVEVAEDLKLPGERQQASSPAEGLRDSLAAEENCQEQHKDPLLPQTNEVADIQRPVALPTSRENTTTSIASASSSTTISSAQLQLKPENTEMARQYLAAVNAIYGGDSTSFSWSSGQSNQVSCRDFVKARHDFLSLLGELQMNHLSLDLEECLGEFHSIMDSIGDCGLSMTERSKVSNFLVTTRNYHKFSMALNSQKQTLQVKIAEKDQNFVAIGPLREKAITQEKALRKSEEAVTELEQALQAAKEACATAETTFMQTITDLKTGTDLDRTFELNDPTIELAELECSAGHRRESFEKAVAEMINLVKKMQYCEKLRT